MIYFILFIATAALARRRVGLLPNVASPSAAAHQRESGCVDAAPMEYG